MLGICYVPYIRDLLEKITAKHPVEKFSVFYENRRYITVFIRAHHWTPPESDETISQSHIVFL
jgi:hypothetical protein